MKYERIHPTPRISHLVQFFWNFEGDFTGTSTYRQSTVASIYPKLAFQYIAGMEVSENGSQHKLFVSGFQSQTSSSYQLSSNQKVGIFGVYFQPYALPLLFDAPAHDMANQQIEITSILGKAGAFLEEQVLSCRNVQERVHVITRFVEERISTLDTGVKNIITAVGQLISHDGNTRMQELLRAQFLSQRQFERNFKHLAGFSPKYFSRIVRFEKSIANAYDDPSLSLTDLALRSGYFDQAHMIRDYRQFAGKKPSTYFAENLSLFLKE